MSARIASNLGAFVLLVAAGCSEEGSGAPAGAGGEPGADAAPAGGVTYHKNIRPLLEANCVGCHVEGGSGPFPLDQWSAVEPVASLAVMAVTAEYMPPWPASDECHDLRDVRDLTADERALFTAWQDNAFAEGVESDYAPPAAAASTRGDPDLVLSMPAPYKPERAVDNDTRCFLTEGTLPYDTYLTAMDIRPGERAQVHHVQVHRVAAADVAAVRAVDEASPTPGYPCAEDGVTTVNMFSWRPGTNVVAFAEGDAVLIEAGSAIVLQVHYNTQFLADADTAPDTTSVAFWTLPEGVLPDRVVIRVGHFGLLGPNDVIPTGMIAAGAPLVVGGLPLPLDSISRWPPLPRLPGAPSAYLQGEIIGMTPHMHMLGTRLTATLKRADGTEACMIDVPEWDYKWQLDYYFRETVTYDPTDVMQLVCEYDNSPENQPVLDGVRVEPRDVTWGEGGTFDEMCLNYVWLRYPRDAFFAARAAAMVPPAMADAGAAAVDAGTPAVDAGAPAVDAGADAM